MTTSLMSKRYWLIKGRRRVWNQKPSGAQSRSSRTVEWKTRHYLTYAGKQRWHAAWGRTFMWKPLSSCSLSRRRQTVLETVQHSSALLTRVHIATGALISLTLPQWTAMTSVTTLTAEQRRDAFIWFHCFWHHFLTHPSPFLFRSAPRIL